MRREVGLLMGHCFARASTGMIGQRTFVLSNGGDWECCGLRDEEPEVLDSHCEFSLSVTHPEC